MALQNRTNILPGPTNVQKEDPMPAFSCPPNLESLPAAIRSAASSRAFRRPHGLRSWLRTCGVTDPQLVEQIVESAMAGPVTFSGSDASQLLGANVYNKMGHSRDAMCASGLVAVYHSANYCKPCHGFTPELIRFYNEAKSSGVGFEVVFASWDKTKEEFEEYYAKMPWCALPYGDAKIEKLKAKEGVKKIPSLVIYREDGSLVQSFGNEQFCRHDVTEVGLHPMGGVSLVLDAWKQGTKPVVPAQVALSFDMDDDF